MRLQKARCLSLQSPRSKEGGLWGRSRSRRQRQDLPATDPSHRPVTRHISGPRVDCALICQNVEDQNRKRHNARTYVLYTRESIPWKLGFSGNLETVIWAARSKLCGYDRISGSTTLYAKRRPHPDSYFARKLQKPTRFEVRASENHQI
jgi:hypothetical protein